MAMMVCSIVLIALAVDAAIANGTTVAVGNVTAEIPVTKEENRLKFTMIYICVIIMLGMLSCVLTTWQACFDTPLRGEPVDIEMDHFTPSECEMLGIRSCEDVCAALESTQVFKETTV